MPDSAEAPPLAGLAARTAALTGWRRYGLALLLGAAAALAFEPFNLIPLLVPAFAGLVWLNDGAARRRAVFATGWWFGVGHFALGLYWVTLSFLVEPEKFAWMIPFVMLGMSGGLALFPACAVLAASRCRGRGAGRVLYLAAAWTAFEWLRGHVLTGFPWNLMGNVWTAGDETMQLASLTGIYGLSLLTVLIAALPATLGDRRAGPAGGVLRPWRASAVAAVLLIGLWGFGAARLATAGDGTGSGTANSAASSVRLRIVQANIAQTLKWRRDLRAAHLAEYIELTRGPGFADIDVVVWPETAAPYFLGQNARRRLQAASAAPPGGLLITGAPRTAPATGPNPRRFWNSLYAIRPSGEIAATYDKHHLVPFGEYVPFRRYLDLEKITHGRSDFTPGPGPRTLAVAGLPEFGPLICYEAIFSGSILDRSARPAWLLNITNDAWFGASSGPYQHLASARLRAVEEGLPLVRSANTGISAVIDAYGRVTAHIGINRKGVLDALLPKPIFPVTLYGRFGDVIPLFLLMSVAAAGFAVSRQR
jgi:apolipoprotein N-acyltransferase